jgi:hypothetical protein
VPNTTYALLVLLAVTVVAVAAGIYIGRRWPSRRPLAVSDGPEGFAPQARRSPERGQAAAPAAPDVHDDGELPNYCQRVVPFVRPERWRFSENLTELGRRVIADAHLQAYAHHSDHVGTEHMLIALLDDCPQLLSPMLHGSQVSPEDVREHVESVIGPKKSPRAAHLPYSPHLKRALATSVNEAQQRGGDLIDAGHILHGLLSEENSACTRFLTELGVDLGRLSRPPTWYGFRRDRSVS